MTGVHFLTEQSIKCSIEDKEMLSNGSFTHAHFEAIIVWQKGSNSSNICFCLSSLCFVTTYISNETKHFLITIHCRGQHCKSNQNIFMQLGFMCNHRYQKRKNRLLKFVYCARYQRSTKQASFLFLLRPFTVLMKKTRAVKQSIIFRCLWVKSYPQ